MDTKERIRKFLEDEDDTNTKIRPSAEKRRSQQFLPGIFQQARVSVDPHLQTVQSKSLALLKDNPKWDEFDRRVICYRTLDPSTNQKIAEGFNFIVVNKSFLENLHRQFKTRRVSNPLQLATLFWQETLLDQYLYPACEALQLSSNSPQIDFIIQATLNEFTASNIDDTKNEMLKTNSEKLDSQKLFDYFKGKFDESKYRYDLESFRKIIFQVNRHRSRVDRTNKTNPEQVEPQIKDFRIPNKEGRFINEMSFITKFAAALLLEEKDLKGVPLIVFQSFKSISAKENKPPLIDDLNETDLLYFNEKYLMNFSLFAKIKEELKLIVKATFIDNKKLMSDVDRLIKNDKNIVKEAIDKATTSWLTEKLEEQKKKIESKSLEPLETKEIVIEEEDEEKVKKETDLPTP